MLLRRIKLLISFAILIFMVENVSAGEHPFSRIGIGTSTPTSQSLNISAGKGWIIIYCDGRIELKDTNLDEAAKEFWHRMAITFPIFKKNIIDEYKKELKTRKVEGNDG